MWLWRKSVSGSSGSGSPFLHPTSLLLPLLLYHTYLDISLFSLVSTCVVADGWAFQYRRPRHSNDMVITEIGRQNRQLGNRRRLVRAGVLGWRTWTIGVRAFSHVAPGVQGGNNTRIHGVCQWHGPSGTVPVGVKYFLKE